MNKEQCSQKTAALRLKNRISAFNDDLIKVTGLYCQFGEGVVVDPVLITSLYSTQSEFTPVTKDSIVGKLRRQLAIMLNLQRRDIRLKPVLNTGEIVYHAKLTDDNRIGDALANAQWEADQAKDSGAVSPGYSQDIVDLNAILMKLQSKFPATNLSIHQLCPVGDSAKQTPKDSTEKLSTIDDLIISSAKMREFIASTAVKDAPPSIKCALGSLLAHAEDTTSIKDLLKGQVPTPEQYTMADHDEAVKKTKDWLYSKSRTDLNAPAMIWIGISDLFDQHIKPIKGRQLAGKSNKSFIDEFCACTEARGPRPDDAVKFLQLADPTAKDLTLGAAELDAFNERLMNFAGVYCSLPSGLVLNSDRWASILNTMFWVKLNLARSHTVGFLRKVIAEALVIPQSFIEFHPITLHGKVVFGATFNDDDILGDMANTLIQPAKKRKSKKRTPTTAPKPMPLPAQSVEVNPVSGDPVDSKQLNNKELEMNDKKAARQSPIRNMGESEVFNRGLVGEGDRELILLSLAACHAIKSPWSRCLQLSKNLTEFNADLVATTGLTCTFVDATELEELLTRLRYSKAIPHAFREPVTLTVGALKNQIAAMFNIRKRDFKLGYPVGHRLASITKIKNKFTIADILISHNPTAPMHEHVTSEQNLRPDSVIVRDQAPKPQIPLTQRPTVNRPSGFAHFLYGEPNNDLKAYLRLDAVNKLSAHCTGPSVPVTDFKELLTKVQREVSMALDYINTLTTLKG